MVWSNIPGRCDTPCGEGVRYAALKRVHTPACATNPASSHRSPFPSAIYETSCEDREYAERSKERSRTGSAPPGMRHTPLRLADIRLRLSSCVSSKVLLLRPCAHIAIARKGNRLFCPGYAYDRMNMYAIEQAARYPAHTTPGLLPNFAHTNHTRYGENIQYLWGLF